MENLQLEQDLLWALDEQMQREEILWRQKARVTWLTSSESNTKYFHASTIIRRCQNTTSKLKTDNGEWISGRVAIGSELVAFYQQFFSSSEPTILYDLENLIDPVITREDNELLTMVPDAGEIYCTFRKMSTEKAPGLDGMMVLFFKHFWEVVGADVVRAVQDLFVHGECFLS